MMAPHPFPLLLIEAGVIQNTQYTLYYLEWGESER